MAEFEVTQLLVAGHLFETASEVFDRPACSHWEQKDEGMNEERVVREEERPIACFFCLILRSPVVICTLVMALGYVVVCT